MIPILFESTEMQFTTNGICRLVDCTSCLVTEKRNGLFEVEFKYPLTGAHFSDITNGRIICVTHDEQGDLQPFRIYRRSAPLRGVVTFNCRHISYELSTVVVTPFTATNCSDAFYQITQHAQNTCRFTFWTDNITQRDFAVDNPASVRSILGGTKGSILDTYGGEYEWDKWTVRNYAHRGQDNGVVVRYGKNLTSMTHVLDTGDLYNAIIPYWLSTDGVCVYGSIVKADPSITDPVVVARNFSDQFQEEPTIAQLETAAANFLTANTPWVPKVSIAFDFVALWQTDEYKYIAPVEHVRLCDTVRVEFPELGVTATARAVRVVWDALAERFTVVEIGDARSTLTDTVQAAVQEATKDIPTMSSMEAAIKRATDIITGSTGGHLVIDLDANGEPEKILIMDTVNKATARDVLQINKDGIGFSSNGIGGPYSTAWTIDGHFVADYIDTGSLNAALITVGTMLADRIHGGTLTLGGNQNGNGVLEVQDAAGNTVVTINNAGVDINKGEIDIGNGAFHVDSTGAMTARNATLNGIFRSENNHYWMQISNSELTAGYDDTTIGSLSLARRSSDNYYWVNLASRTYNIEIGGNDVYVAKGRDNNLRGSVVITPDSDVSRVRYIYISDVSGGGKALVVQDAYGTYYWAQLNSM